MAQFKTAKTIRDYSVSAYGYNITVPAGSTVRNKTATGGNDNCHFWTGWRKTARDLTGCDNSILAHDLAHYGINIPAEYCEDYPKD